jgi:hypothetical protein
VRWQSEAATPLLNLPEPVGERTRVPYRKAPATLRSAGALQTLRAVRVHNEVRPPFAGLQNQKRITAASNIGKSGVLEGESSLPKFGFCESVVMSRMTWFQRSTVLM